MCEWGVVENADYWTLPFTRSPPHDHLHSLLTSTYWTVAIFIYYQQPSGAGGAGAGAGVLLTSKPTQSLLQNQINLSISQLLFVNLSILYKHYCPFSGNFYNLH